MISGLAVHFNVKRMDHLGLVAGFCKEIGLEAFINERLPKNSHRSKISNGTLLTAMILNGLGFVSRTLHMYPEYFEDKPTERLLGADIKAAYINDDALGRCLDELYEAGVSNLYQELAEKVINHLKMPCHSINMDTTSFHLDGKYESDIDAQGIKITKGYSRDHRPDLNQVILQLITENQAGIPLYMQACSGNSNDTKTFKALVKYHVHSLKAAFKNKYLIADAALYDEEILQALAKEKQLFITRVPQKLKEAKEIIAQAGTVQFTKLSNGYAGAWFRSNYGDVAQRWLLIKSEQAKDREQHILEARIKQETSRSCREFKKLCRQKFACETDALAMLANWEAAQNFVKVHDSIIKIKQKRAKRGRPSIDDVGNKSYYINGHLATDLQSCKQAASTTGLFILSTNDISDKLTMQFLLDEYKSQQAVLYKMGLSHFAYKYADQKNLRNK